MQRIPRDDYKQLDAIKMDNLEEMDQSSKTKPGWNGQDKRTNLSTEIETMFKKLPTNKSPGPDGIIGQILPNI